MKNHYRVILFFIFLPFGLIACTSIDTGSECLMDEQAVTEFVTYAWLPEDSITTLDNTENITPEMVEEIQVEIEHGFADAGYLLIEDAESADFIIAATLVTQKQLHDTVFFPAIDSDVMSDIHPDDLHLEMKTTGVLTIDAYEGVSGLPFWRGWAHRPLAMSDKKVPRKIIRQAVTTIIAQFPHRRAAKSAEKQSANAGTKASKFSSAALICSTALRV